MRYVCSDIHGKYGMLMDMLQKISFDEKKDHLYILGDIFDRGIEGLAIYHFIKRMKHCVTCIRGNHEVMLRDTLLGGGYWWGEGYSELMMYPEMHTEFIKWVDDAPLFIEIDDYILVHAAIDPYPRHYPQTYKEVMESQDEEYCTWERDLFLLEERPFEDKTVVFGHTTTQMMDFCPPEKRGYIYHFDGRIAIDCGAPFKEGRLGCLCLDTKEEFYVEFR